jgi:predicted secreted hydrolase
MRPLSKSILVLLLVLFSSVVYRLPVQADTPNCSDLAKKSTLINGLSNGFKRAIAPYTFNFPTDYGAHPNFQLEWWYYTGNLATADGRRFGYQFTIFRYGVFPPKNGTGNGDNLYAADLAISDIQGNRFLSAAIPPSVGRNGARTTPSLQIRVGDWIMRATDHSAKTMQLTAQAENFAIDLTTQQVKPPALHGDQGLSAKGPLPGEASYYYSLTRLPTTGTLTIDHQDFSITGDSWMDHEFSTGAMDKSALGWDWFAIQLGDQREIMIYLIRSAGGSLAPQSEGTLIDPDGTTHLIPLQAIQVDVRDHWTSPQSTITYPASWQIALQLDTGPLTLTLQPLMSAQEQRSITTYWEGAVAVAGRSANQAVSGYGYVEMTGYPPANCTPNP